MNGLGDGVFGDRDPLQKSQRPSAVVHPENDDRHVGYLIPSALEMVLCARALARPGDGMQRGRPALLVVTEDL
jgi:hypothetical protein